MKKDIDFIDARKLKTRPNKIQQYKSFNIEMYKTWLATYIYTLRI